MKKVLIIDDTQTVTALIQVYLMGWSIEFSEARNGAEGLIKARQTKPDLIITDAQMPVMDGFELCAAVRSDADLCEIPILMLTALKEEAARKKGTLVGVTAFLNKPIGVEELRSQVSALLSRPSPQG